MFISSYNATQNADTDLYPLAELYRADADFTLAFLVGNGVVFLERNDDPWYRGAAPGPNWTATSDTGTHLGYYSEEAASPLGCLQQFQFCNGDKDHCGPFSGFLDAQVQSAPFFNISKEEFVNTGYATNNPVAERYDWFVSILGYLSSDIVGLVSRLSAFSLASQQYMAGGFMGAIPDNQWQLDVEQWFATWLAAIQSSVVDVAVGPSEEALKPYTLAAITPYVQETMCNNQVRFCIPSLVTSELFISIADRSDWAENFDFGLHVLQPFRTLLHLLTRSHNHGRFLLHRAHAELPPLA